MPSFSSTELSTSLSEVGWGLTSWELLPPHFCPSDEARAKLELLEEGDSAVVGVSERGWKVVMRSVVAYERLPADSAAKDEQSFETLDHLLAYLSPMFEARRMKLLTDSLANISVRRDWGEGEALEEAEEVTPQGEGATLASS